MMSVENCPVRGVIAKIGDKWSVLVILHLSHDDARFSALRRKLPDISQRVLTATLRKFEREGLVWRSVQDTSPPIVTYGLTALGRTLVTHFKLLAGWAKTHSEEISRARADFDAR
jgi:DNA-binding HxlR family transcriptional regulator